MRKLAGVSLILIAFMLFFGWIFIGASNCPDALEVETVQGLTQNEYMNYVMAGWGICLIVALIMMAVGNHMIHENAHIAMGIIGIILWWKSPSKD